MSSNLSLKQDRLVSQDQKVKIYSLADPRTPDNIRYIGKTILPLNERLNAHINSTKYRKYYNTNWIKSLLREEVKPLITQIDEVSDIDWVEKEKYYIKLYRELGYKLTNLTDGGEGTSGHKHTEEFKQSRRKPPELLHRNLIRKFSSREEANKAHSEFMKVRSKTHPLKPSIETLKKANIASVAQSSKKVIELKDGEIIAEFNSVAECARLTGLVDSNIARVCRGVSKHTGKRYFQYKK